MGDDGGYNVGTVPLRPALDDFGLSEILSLNRLLGVAGTNNSIIVQGFRQPRFTTQDLIA